MNTLVNKINKHMLLTRYIFKKNFQINRGVCNVFVITCRYIIKAILEGQFLVKRAII